MPARRPAAPPPARSRLPLVAAAVVVIAGLALLAVVATGGDDEPDVVALDPTATTVAVAEPTLPPFQGGAGDPAVGRPAPRIDGVDLTGAPMSIVPGQRPQLVVFLAHWCQHCRAEVPRLVDWMAEGRAEGIDVVAVATANDPDAPNHPPAAWLEREDWPGRVLSDDRAGRAATAYGLTSYPFMVALAADGTVAVRASGELSADQLDLVASMAIDAGGPS